MRILRSLDDWLFEPAPAQRLATMRILVGAFTTAYFAVRSPVIAPLRNRPASEFEPVGPLAWLDQPLPDGVFVALLVAAVGLGLAFTLGVWFRITGPALALVVITLTTYRSSWGQLLHFENLMALHVVIVGLAPSADAWSIDRAVRPGRVRRPGRHRLGPHGTGEAQEPAPKPAAVAYGWPLRLAAITTVSTYVLAGVAKLRLGGTEWLIGDTLQNHLAYSATRLELLGAAAPPLSRPLVEAAALLPVLAVAAVVIELIAPLALFMPRARLPWVVCAWMMHAVIVASMFIVFPYPLVLVAFAPFFAIERGAERLGNAMSSLLPGRRTPSTVERRTHDH